MMHLERYLVLGLLLWFAPLAFADRQTLDFNKDWRFWLGAVKDTDDSTPTETLATWTFDRGLEGWSDPQQCTRFAVANGVLNIIYEGRDPQFNSPPISVPGPVDVRLRVRSLTGGGFECPLGHTRQGLQPDSESGLPGPPRAVLAGDHAFPEYI